MLRLSREVAPSQPMSVPQSFEIRPYGSSRIVSQIGVFGYAETADKLDKSRIVA